MQGLESRHCGGFGEYMQSYFSFVVSRYNARNRYFRIVIVCGTEIAFDDPKIR